MRYMLLVYTKEDEMRRASQEEMGKIRDGHWEVLDETRNRGILQGAEPLAPVSTATTVRRQNGKTVVIDGPFAETKEQLAGYYILDCNDLDEAIRYAARIPTGCGGSSGCIEIRQFREVPARTGSVTAPEAQVSA
jgi:hypothetical protein